MSCPSKEFIRLLNVAAVQMEHKVFEEHNPVVQAVLGI
jgi:hypothetical protein